MQTKEIFQIKYNSNFSEYISKAEKNIENHFSTDSFLTIHGLDLKTRDLGISCFSNNYLSVDRHLLNVTYQIGLAKFSNIDDNVWKRDCVNSKNYIEVSNFLIEVTNITKITPYYLDRLFWTYGKWIFK